METDGFQVAMGGAPVASQRRQVASLPAMEIDSTLRESMAQIVATDSTVQAVALMDPSGLLVAKHNRMGAEPLQKEEAMSSLATTAMQIAPDREPGVVCIETERRTLFLRKDAGHTVIVAHDVLKDDV